MHFYIGPGDGIDRNGRYPLASDRNWHLLKYLSKKCQAIFKDIWIFTTLAEEKTKFGQLEHQMFRSRTLWVPFDSKCLNWKLAVVVKMLEKCQKSKKNSGRFFIRSRGTCTSQTITQFRLCFSVDLWGSFVFNRIKSRHVNILRYHFSLMLLTKWVRELFL